MVHAFLQYDLDNDGNEYIRRENLPYGEIMSRITNDEHYAEGICGVFAVIASDDDGNFNEEYINRLMKSLLGR